MMLKTFALAAALMLATAVPAAAESVCSEPIAPAPINGATVTMDQLKANLADVKTFLKQSDDYQICLIKELNDAKDAAKKAKTDVDPALVDGTTKKIQANQALKEKVGAEYNAAAGEYKKAHPGA